jgi:hypothetical protein
VTPSIPWLPTMPTSPCIAWDGYLDRYGYGKRGGRLAHRLAYEQRFGPIPKGLQIDHRCRNRSCVNVEHLEVVTQRENTLRGLGPASVNAHKTHCSNGHLFDVSNTYLQPGSRRRACRACNRARVARYMARRSA